MRVIMTERFNPKVEALCAKILADIEGRAIAAA